MNETRYRPTHKIRFITAASLFDGHDAAINIMRRMLQEAGAEVIHLGHNRSAGEIVDAAIQEDVQGICISSYQGGHVEFFKYVVDLLRERGADHIQVFGGGGGTIVPEEIEELEAYGVRRIYSPEDGRRMGLEGIIDDILEASDFSTLERKGSLEGVADAAVENPSTLATWISLAELDGTRTKEQAGILQTSLERHSPSPVCVVVGITGTGGAGKSSLTDEIVARYVRDFPEHRVAILSVDPSKRRTGGALLGDRIRLNSADSPRVFVRSLATRGAKSELAQCIDEAVAASKAAAFELVIVETSGIGQGDADITEHVDIPIYVMTPEYGAATQLEKIDMIDFADMIVINKFDRLAAEDALRDVRKQYRRSRKVAHDVADDALPVFGTMASQYNDEGVNAAYLYLLGLMDQRRGTETRSVVPRPGHPYTRLAHRVIPPERVHYLGELVDIQRRHARWIEHQARIVDAMAAVEESLVLAREGGMSEDSVGEFEAMLEDYRRQLDPDAKKALDEFDRLCDAYAGDEYVVTIRGREIRNDLKIPTLSGLRLSRVALPRFRHRGDLFRWLYAENLPGHFPYTAGVFPFKRRGEDPARQFAGEGPPERTNRRFHLLSKGQPAKRLSTAFDSVTLYGQDPDERPDIYGKVGESGVSICTLDDMKRLYDGFDLCDPSTSVSMTINGPAPMILAMFLNTAIDQKVEAFEQEHGRSPLDEELQEIREHVLHVVRGTVQADILKEDQAQNTCIFSTDFALRMMGDVQEYFIEHGVRNYYSVSISGYHIAEAGANPISQLAFTLANGFTYVEYYLARGMKIDDFAPNLSFFFSNGLDPEYTVLGRVARRIWARAIKLKYGGNARSQKLKYHIQTSGRSLHAQEIDFNDIRTTLQALIATFDNCNSLHTNAYDEAITTPTAESVRRALAIQLIINREFGMAKNENALQGSFLVDELTELVEEAVLKEFEALDRRGGVLGAMESQYQRGKIQEESMLYERLKHSGELPIVGVNTFLDPDAEAGDEKESVPLTLATAEEKELQIRRLREFQERHGGETEEALKRLQKVALSGGNVFAELMETVRVASLGQITQALYDVGGRYRRNM